MTLISCSGTSSSYVEPGRVGISAMRVVVIWALSIVVSSQLIETTLFMEATALF